MVTRRVQLEIACSLPRENHRVVCQNSAERDPKRNRRLAPQPEPPRSAELSPFALDRGRMDWLHRRSSEVGGACKDFPARRDELPAPAHRELAATAVGISALFPAGESDIGEIPCIFPVDQGYGLRDEFATDCFLRQLVSLDLGWVARGYRKVVPAQDFRAYRFAGCAFAAPEVTWRWSKVDPKQRQARFLRLLGPDCSRRPVARSAKSLSACSTNRSGPRRRWPPRFATTSSSLKSRPQMDSPRWRPNVP